MQLKHVTAKDGALWFRQGLGTFRRSPLLFLALSFAYLLLMRLVSLPPVIGTVIMLMVLPGVTVGFFAASREVLSGKPAFPNILAAAFLSGSVIARRLLVLGVVYFICICAVFALSALGDDGTFAQMMLFGNMPSEQEIRAGAMTTAQQAMPIMMLGYLVVAVIFWFAPVLVAWHDVPPHKALFFSIYTLWRNKIAFIVYGGLWFLTMLALWVAALLLTALAGTGMAGTIMVMMMVVAVFVTMFNCSLYATYRGCFAVEGPPMPPQKPATSPTAPTR
ncbi:BPSS1780 family membrane protein [Robbsia sp. KACC 23696]|uniref:BPSS1780 family membrane protein n=1 Tax=Robbsia sp. KACC 23696 TaxID=3149231 RepID=UPI00325A94AE